jgi:hypothetical protein
METKQRKVLFRIVIWLILEIILNLVGLDDFADYSEFTFESKLYASQIIIDRQNNLLQQKYKFLVMSNFQISSAYPLLISNLNL